MTVASPTSAVDVNALDEVPNSSWFTNRLGIRSPSAAEIAQGACTADDDAALPLTVVEAKPDGIHPGFIVTDARGRRFLFKVDGFGQAERPTAADAIVAALHHAAGYHVPCNRVVYVTQDELQVSRGDDAPDPDAIAQVLAAASRDSEGRVRAVLSRFVEGRPLGPWTYAGVWHEDANDRVPHELRRELRGLVVLAALVDHVDARGQNTLAAWVGGERGYVRHYLIDFGDCFGALVSSRRRSSRYGHTTWFDVGTVIEDVVTLGAIPRSWYRARLGPGGETLGFFDANRFDPDRWRANHDNGAFELADEGDRAWMARILAGLRNEHVAALVALGRFSRPAVAATLERTLIARRDRILERYLTRLSPLTAPSVDRGALCLEDRARTARLRVGRSYAARTVGGAALRTRSTVDGVCVDLPERGSDYAVIEIEATTPGRDRPHPARVHVRFAPVATVVGLERP